MKVNSLRQEVLDETELPTTFGVAYRQLVDSILSSGVTMYNERTHLETFVLPHGAQVVIPPDEFPLLSLRRLPVNFIVAETLWYLTGLRQIPEVLEGYLVPWDSWKEIDGTIHSPYGFRMFNWQGIRGTTDQVTRALDLLKKDPSSRHAVIQIWDPDRDSMILNFANRPCPLSFQITTYGDTLNLHVLFRSNDIYFGLPNDIASFSLMLQMFAKHLDISPGYLVYTMNDPHIYENTLGAIFATVEQKEQSTPIKLNLPQDYLPGLVSGDINTIENAYSSISSSLRSQYNPAIAVRNVDIAV